MVQNLISNTVVAIKVKNKAQTTCVFRNLSITCYAISDWAAFSASGLLVITSHYLYPNEPRTCTFFIMCTASWSIFSGLHTTPNNLSQRLSQTLRPIPSIIVLGIMLWGVNKNIIRISAISYLYFEIINYIKWNEGEPDIICH